MYKISWSQTVYSILTALRLCFVIENTGRHKLPISETSVVHIW